MLAFAYAFLKAKLPSRKEFKQLAIFGFLNVTLYLSLFILGVNEVAAGIGSLAVSLNPLIITVMSGIVLGQKIQPKSIFVLILGFIGCGVALFPLLQNSFATPMGILYLTLSMFSYSSAAIYFSKVEWQISRTAINGWQVFFGGIFLLPLTFLLHKTENHFDSNFYFSLLWLIFPVSVLAVSLWLWLLKQNTLKASYFLFLCPIFGFTYASFFLGEPFTIYTFCGLVLVLGALGLGQRRGG
jgi:drug/metabolite transporter (DMT)-like permease